MDGNTPIEKPFVATFASLEDERAVERKRKRSLRNRIYYLKNQERIKEYTRNEYYRRQEETEQLKKAVEEKREISTEETETSEKSENKDGNVNALPFFALIVIIVAAVIIARAQQKQRPAVLPQNKNDQGLDTGGGGVISDRAYWPVSGSNRGFHAFG